MCIDSNGRDSGYRDAMTDQQLQMYQFNQQMQAQQMQQLNQQLQQTGKAWQPPPPQPYTAPQVTPLTPPGGNQVRCINAGVYTNCRY